MMGTGFLLQQRDNSNEAYILVGYQDENGDMIANPNASANLEKDYANYNQGKDTELTRSLLETVSKSNIDHATRQNGIDGIEGYNNPLAGIPTPTDKIQRR